jgi:hypothetical protein
MPEGTYPIRDALEIEPSFAQSTHRVKIREFSGSERSECSH